MRVNIEPIEAPSTIVILLEDKGDYILWCIVVRRSRRLNRLCYVHHFHGS